ncbi:MAG: formylmethanofuran dehydrogenase [Syntrophomonadaceae bacterium]|nr:formylmethanofuran dehydrogenase [Syntrophomonadaceae bacterium]
MGGGTLAFKYPANFDLEGWQRTVAFHGHTCPGLALGYRASFAALRALQVKRAADEELVAIVENDACGVDAVQVITGCTLGKGNLIYRDYGKQVFTFARRDAESAVRIYVHAGRSNSDPGYLELHQKIENGTATAEEVTQYQQRQQQRIQQLLTVPEEEILSLQTVALDLPEKARIFNSVECSRCQEKVAEIRARIWEGRPVCLACVETYTRGW